MMVNLKLFFSVWWISTWHLRSFQSADIRVKCYMPVWITPKKLTCLLCLFRFFTCFCLDFFFFGFSGPRCCFLFSFPFSECCLWSKVNCTSPKSVFIGHKEKINLINLSLPPKANGRSINLSILDLILIKF